MKNGMIFVKNSVTFGPIGYFYAPGTWGSLCALPFVYFISNFSFLYQLVALFFVCLISYYLIRKSLPFFVEKDPSSIIIDEFVGCCITFFYIPYSATTLGIGFLLFRFFDIIKPLGIRYCEELPGAFGILLDDCYAGLLAHIILWYCVV